MCRTSEFSQSRERHPDASMPASSESHVCAYFLPMQDKLLGPLKDIGIAVGCRIAQCNGLFWVYRLAVELDVS